MTSAFDSLKEMLIEKLDDEIKLLNNMTEGTQEYIAQVKKMKNIATEVLSKYREMLIKGDIKLQK